MALSLAMSLVPSSACTLNWTKKVFGWFAVGRAGVTLYVLIYDTPDNSLFIESMVDCDTLLGKELGPGHLK